MFDIHSHLLYGVDDGPSKIEDSMKMIYEAKKFGISKIITTVHYNKSLFDVKKVAEKYHKLIHKIKDFDILVELGYEVFVNSLSTESIEDDLIFTLNKSQYMLIEFPFSEFLPKSYDILYKLHVSGIIPVIAHPERCRFFIENPDVLLSFIEGGCLIQLDAASITGVYGKNSKRLSKLLVSKGKAHFVASNAHFPEDYAQWYKKAYEKVRQWSDTKYAEKLFFKNAEVFFNPSNDIGSYYEKPSEKYRESS